MREEPQPIPRLYTINFYVEFKINRGSRITALIAEPLNGSYGNSTYLSRLSSIEPGVLKI